MLSPFRWMVWTRHRGHSSAFALAASRWAPGRWMQWFVGLSFCFVPQLPPRELRRPFFFGICLGGSFFFKVVSHWKWIDSSGGMEDLSFFAQVRCVEFWKTHEQCSVHPRWLGSVGDEIRPSYEMCYKGIIINQKYKKNIGIPVNQPGFHEMSLVWFWSLLTSTIWAYRFDLHKKSWTYPTRNYYFLGSFKLQKWRKSVKTWDFSVSTQKKKPSILSVFRVMYETAHGAKESSIGATAWFLNDQQYEVNWPMKPHPWITALAVNLHQLENKQPLSLPSKKK